MSADDSALFKSTYRVPSTRLKEWDYSTPGHYFVTICTKDKKEFFGEIVEIEDEPGATIRLSPIGTIVEECWKAIPEHNTDVILDDFIIMPNHIHGILVLEERNLEFVETPYMASLRTQHDPRNHQASPRKARGLGVIIQQFKRACTHRIHQTGVSDFAWQSRFYDHIVRNEKDLERIQHYIRENPAA